MPNLLTLPRELRDEIYKHIIAQPPQPEPHRTPIPPQSQTEQPQDQQHQSKPPSIVKRFTRLPPDPRQRQTKLQENQELGGEEADRERNERKRSHDQGTQEDEDPESLLPHESTIRYPLLPPTPHTSPLLSTSRRLTRDLLSLLKIKTTPITFRATLRINSSNHLIYPTWISVPVSAAVLRRQGRVIDVLDVGMKIRGGKSSSLCTMHENAEEREVQRIARLTGMYWSAFDGGLVLLKRFLEGGVGFGVDGEERRDKGKTKGKERLAEEDGNEEGAIDGDKRNNSPEKERNIHVNLFILTLTSLIPPSGSAAEDRAMFEELVNELNLHFFVPGFDTRPHSCPLFQEYDRGHEIWQVIFQRVRRFRIVWVDRAVKEWDLEEAGKRMKDVTAAAAATVMKEWEEGLKRGLNDVV